MRLDKFRGWGPWLAYASPACFVLAIVSVVVAISFIPRDFKSTETPPAGFIAFAIVGLVLLALWQVTMLAVAIDLEWIEHPLTHTGLTYVALGAVAVATLAMVLSLLTGLLHLPDVVGNALVFLWFGGVGLYLVIINLVGRRARIVSRGLSAIGVIGGAVQVVGALLFLTPFGPLAAAGMFIFFVLYAIWSVWLGFTLRGRAPAAAPAMAGQPA